MMNKLKISIQTSIIIVLILLSQFSFSQIKEELIIKKSPELTAEDSLVLESFKEFSHEKIYELLGKGIPEFSLETLGKDTITKNDFLGKKILLNFWFTRCQPCIDEMPILNEIKEELKNKEIEFIAITFENEKEVSQFLKTNDFNFKHIINGSTFIDELGIKFYPKIVIIDQDGVVRKIEKKVNIESKDDVYNWKNSIINELSKK